MFRCSSLLLLSLLVTLSQAFRFGIVEESLPSSSRLLSLLDEEEDLPPLFPFQVWDYIGFSVAIIGLLLAAGGGIGGGGILVPTYILLLEFPVKHAIPLASATVVGGAIANNLLNARKSHPNHPSRPVIDWDLILQLEPMTILGALVGAVLNDFLPDILLVILMVLLLTVTAHKTLSKASSMYAKESEEMKSQNGAIGETQGLIDNPQGASNANYDAAKPTGDSSLNKLNSMPSFDNEAQYQAFLDALKLTLLFAIVTYLNLIKGGPEEGGGPAGLDKCGFRCFWLSQFGILLVIILFAFHSRHAILARQRQGGAVLSDIVWDDQNTITYPLYAIVAGLVAGLFGVGGGIVKGPLMLALGVHPAVASATSACMILFTSITATTTYMIFGFLIYDYATFCLCLGFFATLVGQTVMTVLMQRYQRHSYIAYSIGGVVGLSAIAMGIESVLALTE